MKRILAVLAAAAALAGCGEKKDPTAGSAKLEPFTVMLDYQPNADHAGIYAAQATGLYRKAGLDVKIVTPPDPSAPLKLLLAGRADLAISYEPDFLLAQNQGAKALVSVAALVQRPLTTLMALPAAKVHTPADLAGKRVGTAGIPYQAAYLRTILKKAGVDPSSVKQTDVGFNLVPAMVSGKVAATLGAYWNVEGVQLRRDGKKPVIMRMDQLGVPTYDELVLVVRKQSLDVAGASRLRRFLQATADATRQLKTNPQVGVDALMAADPGLDRGLLEASVKATLPAFFPEDAKNPWGYQDPPAWARYEVWMRANGLLGHQPSDDPPLTNEFLPGVSPNDATPADGL